MRIVQESKRVLVNLYGTLSKEEEKVCEPCIIVEMDAYAKAINMTKENLNLYLWFLRDAGYIEVDDVTFDKSPDATKKVTLMPNAIRLMENIDHF